MTKDMQPDKTSTLADERRHFDRRSFMQLAGFGAGLAGASLGLGVEQAKAAASAAPMSQPAGYRESEHVRTYYRMARF